MFSTENKKYEYNFVCTQVHLDVVYLKGYKLAH